jgi:hypothetical protein
MSLTVTQRPYQTIDNEISKWNAVRNPVLYKMQRKDFTFASITNSGGFVRLVLDSSFGNVASSFDVDDEVYFTTDAGVYDTTGTVTASSYSAPNTLVTLDTAYISSSTGFVNNDDLRPSYRVEVEVYDGDDAQIGDAAFTYSPTSKGALTIDVSTIIKSELVPDNDVDLTAEVETDENVSTGFYIKYREVWTGSAESQTNDSDNEFFGLLGAMQIPSTYGGNLYDYLILGDMKLAEVTIPTASVLTGNSVPVDIVAAPGAGKVNWPTGFFVKNDYNSAAYATNTDFKFQINGVDVTGTVSNILSATADNWSLILVTGVEASLTTLENQAIKWKVSTGDPTAGNSPLYVKCLYTIITI